MSNENNWKNIMNRVLSFFAGALLAFIVINFTVVDKVKTENTELAAALDASKFQAGRLLNDAKAQLEARDYDRAKSSLSILFDKYPGSTESVDGKVLLAEIEDSNAAADKKWAAAMSGIKEKWTTERITTLRAESEAARVQMEMNMNDKIAQEWENSKENIHKEWEAASQL